MSQTASASAFNMWLSLVDELLEKKIPLSYAMLMAGERLRDKQKEHKDTLFHPADLYIATDSVNILLRRSPQYKQRQAGWAK